MAAAQPSRGRSALVLQQVMLLALSAWPRAARAQDADPRPSAAVSAFQFRGPGLGDASKLLTESVVEELRETQAFSRVVTSAEMEAVLGLERQKQLLSCDQQSCMTELAGALGVDYLIIGTVGRLGKSYLLIVKMLEMRSGRVVASFKQRAPVQDKAVLLDIAELAVKALVRDGKLKKTPPKPDSQKAAPPPAPAPVPQVVSTPAPTGETQPPASTAQPPFARRGPPAASPPNITVIIQQPNAATTPPQPQPGPDTTRETTAAPEGITPPLAPPAIHAAQQPKRGLSPVRLALVGGGGAALAAGFAAVVLGLAVGASGWGLKAFINLIPFRGVSSSLTALQVTYVTLWVAGLAGVGLAALILLGGGVATAVGWALPD